MPIAVNTVSKAGEFGVPVPDQMPEAMPGFFKVGGEVPGQLRKPRAGRIPGHAQHVDPAGSVLDHECHIQPGQGERAIHVEEVDRQDRPGVGTEKCAP